MFDTLWLAFQHSPPFFVSTVFVVSLLVGSFLNVVIYRLPVMMETQWRHECEQFLAVAPAATPASPPRFNLCVPRSRCPHCGTLIRAWQNIPVLSYLLLGGKCQHCGTAISLRYPAIELLTACAASWVAWHYGASLQAVVVILITYALISLIFIDIDHMLLPDHITLPLLWLGLVLSLFDVFVSPHQAIAGAALGYLSLWSVYWLFKLVTGKEGMGFGDFKLLAALGAFTGAYGLPVIIIASSLVGALCGIMLMIARRQGAGLAIPFGPYLAIAGWLTLLYQDIIVAAYWQWISGQ